MTNPCLARFREKSVLIGEIEDLYHDIAIANGLAKLEVSAGNIVGFGAVEW